MAVDVFNYTISTNASDVASKALSQARQWVKNYDYEAQDVCIFNNSFFVSNYSHNSGISFNTSAWTKINDSADKVKDINVISATKANNRVLTYEESTNSITFKDIPSQIDDTLNDSTLKTYSINKIKQLNDLKIDKTSIGVANGIVPLDSNNKIPSQYISITGSGNTTYVKNTILERNALTNLKVGDACIVLVSDDGSREGFIWDGSQWLKDSDSDWQNVNIDWVNIINKPVLPTTNDIYTKTEMDTIVGNQTLQTTAQDLKGAINEVKEYSFQYGVSKKENLVSKLTSKGVTGLTTVNTWDEVINSIDTIPTSSSNVTEVTKLNVTASIPAPYTHTVPLTNTIVDKNIVYGVREFVQGNTQTNLVSTFNNTDSSSFKPNSNIKFDGSLKLADIVSTNDMINEGVLDVGNLYSYTIDKSQYGKIKTVEVVDGTLPQFKISALNNPSVAESNGDIDLTNVDTWNSIVFNTITTNGGKALLAVSVDQGTTYKAYNIGLSAWQTVDITNLNDFSTKGMSKTVTDSLTSTQLELLRNGSNKVRFVYYFSTPEINSIAESTDISVGIKMMGSYSLANKADYDVLIGGDNKSIQFKFYKNGTFTMNYMG